MSLDVECNCDSANSYVFFCREVVLHEADNQPIQVIEILAAFHRIL